VLLWVSDTGVGLPAENADQTFTRSLPLSRKAPVWDWRVEREREAMLFCCFWPAHEADWLDLGTTEITATEDAGQFPR
jgi:hypothetical protein